MDATDNTQDSAPNDNAGEQPQDLHTMHWSSLKKMCEEAGIEYKGKEQAIAELTAINNGQGTTGDTPAAPVKGGDRLNKRLPFGEVFGEVDGAPGARYCQGGCFYNGDGEKVG